MALSFTEKVVGVGIIGAGIGYVMADKSIACDGRKQLSIESIKVTYETVGNDAVLSIDIGVFNNTEKARYGYMGADLGAISGTYYTGLASEKNKIIVPPREIKIKTMKVKVENVTVDELSQIYARFVVAIWKDICPKTNEVYYQVEKAYYDFEENKLSGVKDVKSPEKDIC